MYDEDEDGEGKGVKMLLLVTAGSSAIMFAIAAALWYFG